MNATSQKALIMSEAEMDAFSRLWSDPEVRERVPLSYIRTLADLKQRIDEELKRESGSTL